MNAQPALLGLLALLMAAPVAAQLDDQAPWPTANHDYRHTSRSPHKGPAALHIKWTFAAGGTVWGPSVGRDGVIYVPSDDGNLYALNPDGVEKWRFDLESRVSANVSYAVGQHVALAADGTIYATGMSLFAVNHDGTEKWRFNAPGVPGKTPGLTGFQSPMIGPDGTVYQSSTDGTLYALNPADGSVKWSKQFTAGVRIQAPISFTAEGNPLVSLRKGGIENVFKLSPAGEILWRFTGPDEMRAVTVADDGTLYAAAKIGQVFGLNPLTGIQLWSQTVRNAASAVVEFPALDLNGNALVGSGEGEIAEFSPLGLSVWSFQPDLFRPTDPVTGQGVPVHMGTPVVDADGTLYVSSPESDAWIIGADGKPIDRLELPALFTRMAMGADGTLYCGSQGGTLYAFDGAIMRGDGNRDGAVNVTDAVIALQMIVGVKIMLPADVARLDVAPYNPDTTKAGDSRITVSDVIALLKQAVNPRPGWPDIPSE